MTGKHFARCQAHDEESGNGKRAIWLARPGKTDELFGTYNDLGIAMQVRYAVQRAYVLGWEECLFIEPDQEGILSTPDGLPS